MILPVAELDSTLRAEMRALLDRHFTGIKAADFERDLNEKDAVLLLRDAAGQLGGFSTLMHWTVPWLADCAEVFFSGDTVVAGELRSGSELARHWSRYVFAQADRLAPRPCFWFLICSSYRTYRFLPVFFREFYPTFTRATPPPWQELLDRLARQKFGPLYHQGIVRLQAGVREHDTGTRTRDPHVAFFLQANPDHALGHELACLTRLEPANLTSCGRRMVGL